MHPRPSPGDFIFRTVHSLASIRRSRALMMPTTVSLTGVAIPKGLPRRRIAPLMASPSQAAAGVIVQQHRRGCIGNFAAEFSDMLDGIADVQPDVGGLRHRDGFLGAATLQASESERISPTVSPVVQDAPEK